MPDGVLYERLKGLVRDAGIQCLGWDVQVDEQAVVESGLLDFEVPLEEVQLLAKRDLLHRRLVQRHPQQLGQLRHHLVGGLRVAMDQRRDRMQGVEQEMRMQLHPQDLELGLRQLRFELRRPQLTIAEAAIVHPRLIDRQDGRVGQVG